MTALTFDALKGDYARLWEDMEIRPSKAADIKATAKKIVGKKSRYQAVEKAVGVPWYVVAVIHAMESGCNFATHLHNGDPLTKRTVQVPAGRPKAPPADGKVYSWKESACDALTMKGLDKIADWPIERIAFELERYNGWGYRRYHASTLTPYLWSGTGHYARGKYVADGKWSATAVSGQSGAMAILKACVEIDADIRSELYLSDVPPVHAVDEIDPAAEFPKAEPKPVSIAVQSSRTVFGTLLATIGAIFAAAKEVVTDAASQIVSLAPAREVLGGFGVTATKVAFVITVAGCLYAIYARLNDAHKGANTK